MHGALRDSHDVTKPGTARREQGHPESGPGRTVPTGPFPPTAEGSPGLMVYFLLE